MKGGLSGRSLFRPGAVTRAVRTLARSGPRLLFEDALLGLRFYGSLPHFLRHPISSQEARRTLRRRLERREVDFLALARRAVYANAASPYRRLLELAGCEYGDFERLVRKEGVEAALVALHGQGVYLTVDELKGRRPAVRGSATIPVAPSQLWNPTSTVHLLAQTGGSRGTRTPVPLDLGWVREGAVNKLLALEARGGAAWRHANWETPGGGALVQLLRFSAIGAPAVRGFVQLDAAIPGVSPAYRRRVRLLRWVGRMVGVPQPRPRYIALERPLPIAHWMAATMRAGATPHLMTFTSPAVRLCRAALDAGVDLDGAQLTVTGEPLTAARLAAIRRAGASVVSRYGSSESGTVGYGCLRPEAPDEVHLFHDLHALVQPGSSRPDSSLPEHALLLSSLRPTAPVILLNVSMGDRAELVQRACGCPLERLGWTTQLRSIRSFEKLTAGGMTFLDTDVIRVLEVVLPARFGGGPTDYQLIEDEAAVGGAGLRLLVSPALGPLDADAVARVFLEGIGSGSPSQRIMALQWGEGGMLRVERRAPLATASGKILHLHQERPASIGGFTDPRPPATGATP